ncbi:MAG: SOS response-associated peptidase [Deltaproteobacteria bacterium]|jgi:putative SOS response-associated peptidase YedK|nr:SOS response-associated peptidase [Deltaproteobacteria bacterium]
MCGRFYISSKDPASTNLIGQIDGSPMADLPIKTEGEIFPDNMVAVVTLAAETLNGTAAVKPMIWGFPGWNSRELIINARAETALVKPMFKKSLTERRLAIITKGFFEWKAVTGQKKKDKYLFTMAGESNLILAGFWNTFPNHQRGPISDYFTILTTEANASMQPYHNRMPVMINQTEITDWLKGTNLNYFLEREQTSLTANRCEK